MKIVGTFVLVVGLSMLDLSNSKPQQQSIWIIQKETGDNGVGVDISVDDLSNIKDLENLLHAPSLRMNKDVTTRCYRDDVPTIDVNLYYEALCGGCMNFVENELYPTYQKLGKYINLKLLPYGNTQMSETPDSQGNHIFTCQHGKDECANDLYQACVIDKIADSKLQLEIIHCLMGSRDAKSKTKECMANAGVGPNPSFQEIDQCANGKEGNKLMYKLGLATNSLKPPHEYTPWITINEEHSFAEGPGLESFLCSDLLKEAPECKQQLQNIKTSSLNKCFREDSPAPTVLIEAYYEALCGGCMHFIQQLLEPTYTELHKYLNVQLYPYGNTRISKDLDPYGMHVFACQHGVEECVNNLFQACLFNKVVDTKLQVLLASCLMGSEDPHMKTKECMKKFNVSNVSFEEINICATGKEGNDLMYKLSVATSSLNPPHKYAPWVTIDGKHSANAEDDLKSFLCQGTLKTVPECRENDSSPIIQLL